MNAKLSEDIDAVDWDRMALIFRRAPLGDRDAAGLRTVFENSGVRCFAWDGRELVGAGRAITDGVRYAVIFDVVLLPEYQGHGIGKKIITFLIERSQAANVLLHAVPGKEAFYQKFGFRKMKTAMGRFEHAERQHEWGYIE